MAFLRPEGPWFTVTIIPTAMVFPGLTLSLTLSLVSGAHAQHPNLHQRQVAVAPLHLFPGVVVTDYPQFMASNSTHLFSYKERLKSKVSLSSWCQEGGFLLQALRGESLSLTFSASSSCLYSWSGRSLPPSSEHIPTSTSLPATPTLPSSHQVSLCLPLTRTLGITWGPPTKSSSNSPSKCLNPIGQVPSAQKGTSTHRRNLDTFEVIIQLPTAIFPDGEFGPRKVRSLAPDHEGFGIRCQEIWGLTARWELFPAGVLGLGRGIQSFCRRGWGFRDNGCFRGQVESWALASGRLLGLGRGQGQLKARSGAGLWNQLP